MTLVGPDLIADEVKRVLERLEVGPEQDEHLESRHVDLKEEAGRRRGNTVLGAQRENEVAAQALTGEAICMANTERGGVLVVGVADDGTVIGTSLDAEWLRRRIHQLSQGQLTVVVEEVRCREQRLLLLRSHEAIHPIAWNHKYRHRVGDSCVEIDAATWEAGRRDRTGFDWSDQPSNLGIDAVRPAALQRARDFLTDAADEHSMELASLTDVDLLRRLNVLTQDGWLRNAGALAFVGRDTAAIDYTHREVAGGDSLRRLRASGRGLLEELYDVDAAIATANSIRHVYVGLVGRQLRVLPPRAAREALVNGVAHRDWTTREPTLVEHVGPRLIVTSPGGFIGGVTPENIITHPSQPRNRALAELLAALHVAEREGIGFDRMVADMLRLGYRAPSIEELPGPYVRAVLSGSRIDTAWMALLSDLEPAAAATDLEMLLLLKRLVDSWWVDVTVAAPLLQRSATEADDALAELGSVRANGQRVIEPIAGTPTSSSRAWQLTPQAHAALAAHDDEAGTPREIPGRPDIALAWARARGRISSTELGSIVGAKPSNVQIVLKNLERDGLLSPGRENRRGAGFFYLPVF